jgi:hypothetical protein
MVFLDGYDGRYALRCWPGGEGMGPKIEAATDDLAQLAPSALAIARDGRYARIEPVAWSFELNDWVRLETFGPATA